MKLTTTKTSIKQGTKTHKFSTTNERHSRENYWVYNRSNFAPFLKTESWTNYEPSLGPIITSAFGRRNVKNSKPKHDRKLNVIVVLNCSNKKIPPPEKKAHKKTLFCTLSAKTAPLVFTRSPSDLWALVFSENHVHALAILKHKSQQRR